MSKCLFGYLLIMESKGTNLIIACQQALSECCWSLVACCYSQSVTCKAPKKEIATFGELSSCPVSLTFHHLRGTPLQLGPHITSSRGPTLTFHQTSILSIRSYIYPLAHPSTHSNEASSCALQNEAEAQTFHRGPPSATWGEKNKDTKMG